MPLAELPSYPLPSAPLPRSAVSWRQVFATLVLWSGFWLVIAVHVFVLAAAMTCTHILGVLDQLANLFRS